MSEEVDLIKLIADACIGHPHAKIPWPHRLLHAARDELVQLRADIVRLTAERDAAHVDDAKLRKALGQIGRMHLLPDEKASMFTLAMAHRVAKAALATPPIVPATSEREGGR